MRNFLIEVQKKKRKKDGRISKKHIIDYAIQDIKNIDLLNTSVSELYSSINIIQQNLKNIQ